MRWRYFRTSDQIEDQRDDGFPVNGDSLSPTDLGGWLTMSGLGLLAWAVGIEPIFSDLNVPYRETSHQQRPGSTTNGNAGPQPDQVARFVQAVIGDTEDRWSAVFDAAKRAYVPPIIVMFSDRTYSGCGSVHREAGPVYCPADRKVYLELAFFKGLRSRFAACSSGKACEFVKAYVIAHEVGHHVQNLIGILPKVQQMQHAMERYKANGLNVRLELQADCFAGVWAHHSQRKWNMLEPGDVEAAIRVATAIGDDNLQRRNEGRISPNNFTHGTGRQRVQWFQRGLKRGTAAACNTFEARSELSNYYQKAAQGL